MTSVKPVGFFSPVIRSTAAWISLALGGVGITGGVVDISNSNNQLHTAQTIGQELDHKMHNLELVRLRTESRDETRQLAESFRTENEALRSDLNKTRVQLAGAIENLTLVTEENRTLARVLANNERASTDRVNNLITRFTSNQNELRRELATKADSDAFVRTIARVKPSCVMMSSNGDLEKWSGFFLKTNDNELYLATCAHSFKDAGDFVLTKIKVDGEGFPSFEITPPPFKGDKIAYFSSDGADFALIPLTSEILKSLPKNIGLTFRDFDNSPIRAGEKVFSIGNPLGLENTVTTRTITHPSRKHPHLPNNNISYLQIQPSPNPGDSGSALVDENGHFIGVIVHADNRGFAKQGYAVSVSHLRKVLEEKCGLPLSPNVLTVVHKTEDLPSYSTVRKAELAKRANDPNNPFNWLLGLFEAVPNPPLPIDVPQPEPIPKTVPPPPEEGPLSEPAPKPNIEMAPPAPSN